MARGHLSFATALVAVAAMSALGTRLVLAQAAETVVMQKDIAFSPDKLNIKVGQTVVFVNQDPFGHNVYSESAGGEFDIGRQQTGQRSPVVFRRAGTFEAKCRIHPRMRLEIVVSS
jgi:plastocyanin